MKRLYFTRHAITRMAQRNILPSEIRKVIAEDNTIKEYPDDKPYPSKLIIGFVGERPIHVVLSELDEEIIIISAYEPDPELWEMNFTRRKG